MSNNLNDVLEQIEKLGIHVNRKRVDILLSDLNLYQSDVKNPKYPLYLVLRELGNWTSLLHDNCEEPLSNNIANIPLEGYFAQYDLQTFSYILLELNRISNNQLDYKIIHETKYSQDETIEFEFEISGKQYKIEYEDMYGNGTLDDSFISKTFLPLFKGSIKEGYVLAYVMESINFIFVRDQESVNYIQKLLTRSIVL